MVFGYVGASVLGAAAVGAGNWDMFSMTAGLAQSGRGAQVDQAFQRQHDRIDYKAQRQGLHRDDIADLMGLTTGRMDMYNLVGALLLTFALQWTTSSDIVVKAGTWPRWYSTVFCINCFSAVGYLLFSLWFAMHCSITVQSLGTRLRMNFARLSLPNNQQISKLRVPFFMPGGAMERMQKKMFEDKESERRGSDPDIAEALAELEEDIKEDDVLQKPSAWPHAEDMAQKNDSDEDFEVHLRRWLRERVQWLSADAYARACMFVGMNQLLQALTYHVVAAVWSVSVLTAAVCLVLSKLLSVFVLQIDLGKRTYSLLGQLLMFTLEVLPPVYCFLLMLFVFTPGYDYNDWTEGLAAFPVFILHSLWMIYLSCHLSPQVRPSPNTSAARNFAGARSTAGGATDSGEEDSDALDGAESAQSSDSEYDTLGFFDWERRHKMDGLYATEFLPRKMRAMKWNDIISLTQPVPESENFERHPKFDEMPGIITLRFTRCVAALYILAGLGHLFGHLNGLDRPAVVFENGTAVDGSSAWTIWPHARPRLPSTSGGTPTSHHYRHPSGGRRLEGRLRLEVSWPEPASFFKVVSLNCGNETNMFLQSEFASYSALRRPGVEGLDNLMRLSIAGGRSFVFCNQMSCSTLVEPHASDSEAWSLHHFELRQGMVESVFLPASWRRLSASWDESSCTDSTSSCSSALLAGWDGTAIVIASLRRDDSSRSWYLEQNFKVQPGSGYCVAEPAVCSERPEGNYEDVQALQVSSEGRTLAVLHSDGILDAWSLGSGAFLGQWDLGSNYRAMCHDASHLHVVRHDNFGPVLEAVPLPAALQHLDVPVRWPASTGVAGDPLAVRLRR
eukprot:TRINITY_DN28739_c0_g1_i1.p1 TRINITY_DN28739_c0_g1~~TRINITY_DN28739_c0_g1_i1.p1  ORF type:complete len:866 (+),score=140.99 TRINITY_DN28739_c0_g1_i1:64-2598(+)